MYARIFKGKSNNYLWGHVGTGTIRGRTLCKVYDSATTYVAQLKLI